MNKKYIALLRGVTPTGKNKVPMAELRDRLEKAGLSNVRTYIQSGNVLLESGFAPGKIARVIHDQIAEHFGGDIAVIVVDPKKLGSIVSKNPFAKNDSANMHYIFLGEAPETRLVEILKQEDLAPTKWKLDGKVIYMHCPQTHKASKLNNNFVERKLQVTATTRNHNTVNRLVELSLIN